MVEFDSQPLWQRTLTDIFGFAQLRPGQLEVLEEVGVHVGLVTYRGSQPWPFPSSVMLGFRAHAESTDILVDGDEIAEADWYTRARVREEAACGALILPPPDSISRRLVMDWLEEE